MLAAVVAAAFVTVIIAGAQLVINKDMVTFINTALNTFSVYMLVRASRAYRQEVMPRVAKVEEVVTRELDSWDGTDRRSEHGGE